MSRIAPIDPAVASTKSQELLTAVKSKLGMAPNMMKTMAHSPATLEAYLSFSGALSRGNLDAKTRERIAIAMGQSNGCEYCLSAHTLLGKKSGLTDSDIAATRSGSFGSSASDAAVALAVAFNSTQGHLTQDHFDQARKAGLTDAQIVDALAEASLNVFTNWFNNSIQTEIDFPKVALR